MYAPCIHDDPEVTYGVGLHLLNFFSPYNNMDIGRAYYSKDIIALLCILTAVLPL